MKYFKLRFLMGFEFLESIIKNALRNKATKFKGSIKYGLSSR